MSEGLISVIIPCYNLAGYTKRCIDSVLSQTHQNLEVIAIDDGSSDQTPEILAGYAAKDPRVVFIRQENAGAGAAANLGIEIARGDFLAFVDNDDWIEHDMYEKLQQALVSNHADMAICNFNLVYEREIHHCYSPMRSETVNLKEDVYSYFCRFCACPKPNNYMWTKLYKADIVKNSKVRYEDFCMGADTLFYFKLLPEMERVTFIEDGLYNYVQRNDSSVYTMAKRRNIAQVYADGFDALAEYYSLKGLTDFCRVLPLHAFTRLRSIFFYSRLAGLKDDEIIANLEKSLKGRRIIDYLTGAVQ